MVEIDQSRSCIYCNQLGPFSNEHVFPAGLGGDDSRFLLKGLVCARCNTEVFSKLEASFMRSSPTALARAFQQPHGRGKGKKARVVRLDTRMTTVNHPEYGPVEGELSEGRPALLMQFVFLAPGQVGFLGSDRADPRAFLEALRQLLGDEVRIVEKKRRGTSFIYDEALLAWQDAAYYVKEARTLGEVSGGCIWREPLSPLVNVDTPSRHPALYQRGRGQFVFRCDAQASIACLATQARKAVEAVIPRDMPPHVTLERPEMVFTMTMDVEASQRVLAKIGLNVLTYLCGDAYVRHPAFNATRQAILTGEREINCKNLPGTEGLAVLSGVPRDRHVITLAAIRTATGTFHIAMLMSLYGVAYAVELAAAAPQPPIPMAEFVVVEYKTHTIEVMSGVEFIRRYPPNLTQTLDRRSRVIRPSEV
jgi:hypothetical protein